MLYLRQEYNHNMPLSTEIKILTKIKKAKRGTLFFTSDFTQLVNAKAVSKALQRLVSKREIHRVARGIYARLRKSDFGGFVYPGADDIAKAIARKDRAKIIPTGSMAMHLLGLSTQVPLKVVYFTDGSPRKINLGNQTILFKKTTPKTLAIRGELSQLAIQALREIGKDYTTDKEKERIIELLKMEKKTHLVHDTRLAPVWIQEIMRRALDEE